MSVDDVLDSTGLPEVSVRTAEALDRTVRRGREHVRRRRRFGGAAAAIVIVGLVGGLLSITGDDDPDHVVAGPTADDSDRVDVGPTIDDPTSGSWRPIASSPLEQRDQGVAAWTGEEVLIAGGSSTPPCSASADCLRALEPRADGAAYDPGADLWRPMADAPVPFVRGVATWTGSEMLVLADVTNAPDALLSYDPAADRWTRRASPPDNELRSMAWTGDSWVGIAPNGGSDLTAWRYQPNTDSWIPVDPDPIGRLSDRALVWTGSELVLLGSRYDQPGQPPNGLWQAAVLGSDGWRQLSRSEIDNNGGSWVALEGLVVNLGTGRSNGFATGGVLDVGSGTWTALPAEARPGIGGRTSYAGTAGRWVVDDDRLLDPAAGTWHRVEDRGDSIVPAVAVWTGSEIVTWGGTIQRESGNPEPVDIGMAYTPPDDLSPAEPDPAQSSGFAVPGGPTLAPGDAEGAQEVVLRFLDRLRTDDLAGAAELWSGYPDADESAEISALLDRFREEHGWLIDDPAPLVFVSHSTGFEDAAPIVTLLAEGRDGRPRATAFVTGRADDGSPIIIRLPSPAKRVTPAGGSTVEPGQSVTLAATPVEGGVRAFINGSEVPSTLDFRTNTLTIEIPAGTDGDVALTVCVATPEEPAAYAIWYALSP